MTVGQAPVPAVLETASDRLRIRHARYAERRRIQRELHDGLQQELVALVVKLGLVSSSLGRDPDLTRELLYELQDEVRRIIDDLRELAAGIYPSVLADAGLVAAVESCARRMSIPVAITVSGDLREARFPVVQEEAAFYFVAESLTNVLKHSGATRAMVNLSATCEALEVEVRDDGAGLPPSVGTRFGPAALRTRTEEAGGTIILGGSHDCGTTIRARFPFGRPAPEPDPTRQVINAD